MPDAGQIAPFATLPAVPCVAVAANSGQAGALNGKGGGKAQRGNMSILVESSVAWTKGAGLRSVLGDSSPPWQ